MCARYGQLAFKSKMYTRKPQTRILKKQNNNGGETVDFVKFTFDRLVNDKICFIGCT